jgi:hypothetical protein
MTLTLISTQAATSRNQRARACRQTRTGPIGNRPAAWQGAPSGRGQSSRPEKVFQSGSTKPRLAGKTDTGPIANRPAGY